MKLYVYIGTILEAVLLLCVLFKRGSFYNTFPDYSFLYSGALEMAATGTIQNPRYFLTYSNNTIPMLILSRIFGFSNYIGVSEFYPTLMLSVLTVVASIWAVAVLLFDEKVETWILPAIVTVVVYIPIYVFTSSFYADTMSFGIK